MKAGGLGESLNVGDGETDQEVHQDDGHQHREQEEEEVSRHREMLSLRCSF